MTPPREPDAIREAVVGIHQDRLAGPGVRARAVLLDAARFAEAATEAETATRGDVMRAQMLRAMASGDWHGMLKVADDIRARMPPEGTKGRALLNHISRERAAKEAGDVS